MIVRFTDAAGHDPESLADYIAQDNPKRALSFVRELRVARLALAGSPSAFRWFPAMKIAVSAGVCTAMTLSSTG
jgi:toxin ParE1/3/4